MARRATAAQQSYEPGIVLAGGKYRVEAWLGAGTFGQVYRVRHLGLDGARALKVIRRDALGMGSTQFKGYGEQLNLEFRLAERVKHRNVIAIYDLINQPDALYAEMELAEGGSVAQLLKEEGRPSVERAVAIIRDAAKGLSALHRAGAVHRDVKPSNLLLSADGRAKVADLGLAQWAAGDGFGANSFGGSMTARHPGDLYYSSPEHDSLQPMRPTSDVYGLGCVAFELLTGKQWKPLRYEVNSVAQLRPETPTWLDALVMRMLSETPGVRDDSADEGSQRFASMTAVMDALSAGLLAEQQASVPAADDQPSLAHAVALMDAEAWGEAIAVLRAMQSSGTATRFVAGLLADAEESSLAAELRRRDRIEYEEIVILSRGKRTELRALEAWVQFSVEHPDWSEDTEHLAAWADGHPSTVARRQQELEAEERRKAEAAAEAKRKSEAEAENVRRAVVEAEERRRAEAETEVRRKAEAEAKRRAEAEAEATRMADAEAQRKATAAAEARRLAEAARVAAERAAAARQAVPTATPDQVRLLNQMRNRDCPAAERAEAGRKLAELGDPRPGVGLRPDGLPDIAWLDIPTGSFIMGSDDHYDDEKPKRSVTLAAYAIGKYPVTYAQYKAFLEAKDGYANAKLWIEPTKLAAREAQPGTPSWKIANHPAESVSWYDAVAFTRWLTVRLRASGELKADTEIRLPTEAEWERAARGTDGRMFPWGDAFKDDHANVAGVINRTTAVGCFPQGEAPSGMLDAAGNVWEWTLTEHENKRSDDLTNARPRVVRGGSWGDDPVNARSSSRSGADPVYRYFFVGFRVVRAAPVR